jgi:hypothetical protein
MKLEYTHGLDKATAVNMLMPFLEKLQAEHGDKIKSITANWNDNVLSFRLKIKTGIPFIEPELPGTLTVEDQCLVAEAPVPSFAMSKEPEIRATFNKVLDACFKTPIA